MISLDSSGSFDHLEALLKKASSGAIFASLERYGDEGVRALSRATPKDSAGTANAWSYEIIKDKNSYSIIWSNSNVVDKTPVVILLQMGHGTGTGGYVQGRDFINPALKPIFDRIASDVWKVVTAK